MKLVRRSTFNRMKLRLGRLYGRERAEQLLPVISSHPISSTIRGFGMIHRGQSMRT